MFVYKQTDDTSKVTGVSCLKVEYLVRKCGQSSILKMRSPEKSVRL